MTEDTGIVIASRDEIQIAPWASSDSSEGYEDGYGNPVVAFFVTPSKAGAVAEFIRRLDHW